MQRTGALNLADFLLEFSSLRSTVQVVNVLQIVLCAHAMDSRI